MNRQHLATRLLPLAAGVAAGIGSLWLPAAFHTTPLSTVANALYNTLFAGCATYSLVLFLRQPAPEPARRDVEWQRRIAAITPTSAAVQEIDAMVHDVTYRIPAQRTGGNR